LSRKRAGVALLYHGVDRRQGDPKTELSPPVEENIFARQLHYLRKHHRVVRPEDFAAAIASRRRGERFPVCLTFDDDLAQHVDFAMPALRSQSIPATFFLCGASLDRPASSWWERLQRAVDAGHTPGMLTRLLPPDTPLRDRDRIDIRQLGRAVESLTPDQRREFSERLLDEAGPDPPDSGLAREGVGTLAGAGFAIGFHTRDHDTLTSLTDEELERSMEEGREELSQAAGTPLHTIAYPHGRADARVANAARRAGFELGFIGTRLAATGPASDPLLLDRCDTVALGPSLGEFAIGLAWTLLRDASKELTDD
jgi:peptidoglycan/xylan/chitin deacetylase (PgdA/CDA1 family)